MIQVDLPSVNKVDWFLPSRIFHDQLPLSFGQLFNPDIIIAPVIQFPEWLIVWAKMGPGKIAICGERCHDKHGNAMVEQRIDLKFEILDVIVY